MINNVRFIDNIRADKASVYGVGGRLRSSYGLDPHGFRALTDVRVEGATGDFDYARAMFELTVSRGLGRHLDGAITASAGTSAGALPAQRLWYLGGPHTIRGQPAGVAAGNAFWLARADLGSISVGARQVIFADFGWAGNRGAWDQVGRPLSGAGVGASILDGLIRFDVSRGIYPKKGWRTDLYLEARF